MKLLFRRVVLLVVIILMIGACANATTAGQEESSPEHQALFDRMRLLNSERMIQAENQFFENREAYTKSADALREITAVLITYESEPSAAIAAAYPILRKLETVNGRQLYVLCKKELSQEQMALLRESGTVDLFSKAGCWEIDLVEDGIIYWWEPALFFGGGIIYTKNRDGLESKYDIQKELDDNWVTFLYPNI
ncbi:MAG: hypothetical protein GXY67_11460 [Clostridiales bacterium]|nr:hypothetical protein [Clostridiales bacterium]